MSLAAAMALPHGYDQHARPQWGNGGGSGYGSYRHGQSRRALAHVGPSGFTFDPEQRARWSPQAATPLTASLAAAHQQIPPRHARQIRGQARGGWGTSAAPGVGGTAWQSGSGISQGAFGGAAQGLPYAQSMPRGPWGQLQELQGAAPAGDSHGMYMSPRTHAFTQNESPTSWTASGVKGSRWGFGRGGADDSAAGSRGRQLEVSSAWGAQTGKRIGALIDRFGGSSRSHSPNPAAASPGRTVMQPPAPSLSHFGSGAHHGVTLRHGGQSGLSGQSGRSEGRVSGRGSQGSRDRFPRVHNQLEVGGGGILTTQSSLQRDSGKGRGSLSGIKAFELEDSGVACARSSRSGGRDSARGPSARFSTSSLQGHAQSGRGSKGVRFEDNGSASERSGESELWDPGLEESWDVEAGADKGQESDARQIGKLASSRAHRDRMSAELKEVRNKSPDPKYKNFKCTNNRIAQLVNDVQYWCAHWDRGGETEGLLNNVVSPAEKKYISHETGLRHYILENMLVWRRSSLKVLLVFMTISATMKMTSAVRAWNSAQMNHNQPPFLLEFWEWQAQHANGTILEQYLTYNSSFVGYSQAVAADLQRISMGATVFFAAFMKLFVAIMEVISIALVILALEQWATIKASRKRVMYAWYLLVAAPFLGSMIPSKWFAQSTDASQVLAVYTKSVNSLLGLNERTAQVQEACAQVRDSAGNTADNVQQWVNTICDLVAWLPQGNVWIPTSWNPFNWRQFDMAPLHSNCAQAIEYVNSGQLQEAAQNAITTCNQLETTLQEWMNHTGQTAEIVDYFQQRVGQAAQVSASFLTGVQNLGNLLPAALSIAPGLIKGAWRMKMLVPQSNIPGMFVIVLPWLYAPLTWSIYSVVFQLVGSPYLLVGLVLISFTPVVQSAMAMKKHLDRPMTDEDVIVVTKKIGKTLLWMTIIGWVLVVLYFLSMIFRYGRSKDWWGLWDDGLPPVDWGDQQEARIVLDLLASATSQSFMRQIVFTIVLVLTSFFEKYYMTSIAGLDWMVSRLVEVRKIERRMATQPKDEFKMMKKQLNMRLDQLTALDSGKRYSKWAAELYAKRNMYSSANLERKKDRGANNRLTWG